MENQETNVQEQIQVETPEVSTQDEVNEQEWTAPQTKEEFEVALKAAANKSATEILKSLNVKSVKEFKEYQANLENKFNEYNSLQKERDEYAGKYESLVNEHTTLKQERILDKLNVSEDKETREILTDIANKRVNDEKSFEKAIQEISEDLKFSSFFKESKTSVKIGLEKKNHQPLDEVSKYLEKYKGTPYYKNKN